MQQQYWDIYLGGMRAAAAGGFAPGQLGSLLPLKPAVSKSHERTQRSRVQIPFSAFIYCVFLI